MSLISRLKAVVAGDEYLDDEFDELDYASEDELNEINDFRQNQKPSNAPRENSPQYSLGKNTAPEPAWGQSKLSAYSWLICDR